MIKETFIAREKLKEIVENLTLTNHAKERITERLGNDITEEQIKQMILRTSLAWNNTDDTIGIEITPTTFFLISEKKADGRYILITVKEKSMNNKEISHKVYLSFIGKRVKGEERTYKERTPKKRKEKKNGT